MPAATLRRISMKALAGYQVILLGEQRHIRCEQLAQGCCPNSAAVGVEPATSRSRVQISDWMTSSSVLCSTVVVGDCVVLVWVSKVGRTELEFDEPRVKINGAYCLDVLLKKQLLSTLGRISGDMSVFQRDNSSPIYHASDTLEFLKWETPTFIGPDLWLPNSPDLNPVDYKVWATVRQRFYQRKIHDIDELREQLSTHSHLA